MKGPNDNEYADSKVQHTDGSGVTWTVIYKRTESSVKVPRVISCCDRLYILQTE